MFALPGDAGHLGESIQTLLLENYQDLKTGGR